MCAGSCEFNVDTRECSCLIVSALPSASFLVQNSSLCEVCNLQRSVTQFCRIFWVFGIITLFSVGYVGGPLGLVCQCEQDDGPDELILQPTPLLLLKVYEQAELSELPGTLAL